MSKKKAVNESEKASRSDSADKEPRTLPDEVTFLPDDYKNVLETFESNNKNFINILNEMNSNLIDYIHKNNEYIFSVMDESKSNSEKTANETLKLIKEAIKNDKADIDGIIAGASKANKADIGKLISAEIKADKADIGTMISDAIKASKADIGTMISDAIEANNVTVMKILEDNSNSLVQLLGQTNLERALELNEREQRQLETIVRRKASATRPPASDTALPEVIDPLSITQAMDRLRELAPSSYDNYLKCLDTGTESYEDLPEVSCSTERHPQAKLFHDFLQPYLRNNVLDVGCGPQPVPSYLAGWPNENIVGIDPISDPDDHPFKFISGIGEFLPFPDNSFGTVVSGTTLDHYYLLDLGLKEAFRVLEPGGYFVAWITEFEGAPEYDPYGDEVTPYDHEHMYHIDRKWFLPLMQSIGFEVGEVIRFPLPFNYLFMSFRKPDSYSNGSK